MSKRTLLWLLPALLYSAFTLWYTNLEGPLTSEEIDAFVARMEANNSDPESIEMIKAFAEGDTGRQFLMLNAIDLNENPGPVEGATAGEDGAALMGRYMEFMFPALLARGCHPTFMGNAVFGAIDVVGIEGAQHWDQGALFRYRSRRDMIEIVTNPAFAGRHHFKTAALTKTIAYPIEPMLYLSDPRLLLALLLLAMCGLLDALLFRRRA